MQSCKQKSMSFQKFWVKFSPSKNQSNSTLRTCFERSVPLVQSLISNTLWTTSKAKSRNFPIAKLLRPKTNFHKKQKTTQLSLSCRTALPNFNWSSIWTQCKISSTIKFTNSNEPLSLAISPTCICATISGALNFSSNSLACSSWPIIYKKSP